MLPETATTVSRMVTSYDHQSVHP